MSSSGVGLDLANLTRRQWVALGAWFIGTSALGTWGYLAYALERGEPLTAASAFYHTLQLFLLHAPHFEGQIPPALEVARWSALAGSAWALLRLAARMYRQAVARSLAHRAREHVIVCGLDLKGLECVRYEREKPLGERPDVVVIDRAPAPECVRLCEETGAMLMVDDMTSPDALLHAGLHHASAIFVLSPDDNTNCEVAAQVNRLVTDGPPRHRPLVCSVHLGDPDQRTSVQMLTQDAVDGGRVAMRFFDLFDVEARRLLLTDLPIDHGGVRATDTRRVHLVILGLGRMGRALAVRAAQVGHFANAARDERLRLKISVIDRLAPQCERVLLHTYPQFRSCCELEVCQDELESTSMVTRVQNWCHDRGMITSVAICVDDEPRAANAAI